MNSQAMKIEAPLLSSTISLSRSGFIRSPRRILITSLAQSAFLRPARIASLLIRIVGVQVARDEPYSYLCSARTKWLQLRSDRTPTAIPHVGVRLSSSAQFRVHRASTRVE